MNNKNLHVFENALFEHKLTLLRDKETKIPLFRQLIHEVSLMLATFACKDMPLKTMSITTPLATTKAKILNDKAPVIIPILRAGLGMLDAFITLLPQAKVGHIGLRRNEVTKHSEKYYCKVPEDSNTRPIIVVDPMLATGGSAVTAIYMLKEEGLSNISMVNIIAAPEGIEHFQSQHKDVPVYIGVVDDKLNENAYIVPGLGDAGDRLNGTL